MSNILYFAQLHVYAVYLIQIIVFLGPVKLKDKEYNGTVQSIKLNEDYAAAMFDSKVQLHTVSGHYY